jgi:hypothetical protein
MMLSKPLVMAIPQQDPISEIQFCAWVAQAEPGDRLEYHRGFLAIDICQAVTTLEPNARKELELLAERARWSEAARLVHLVQQRCGPSQFSYIAIARPKTPSTQKAVAQLADIAA